jgi:hypothetical protein
MHNGVNIRTSAQSLLSPYKKISTRIPDQILVLQLTGFTSSGTLLSPLKKILIARLILHAEVKGMDMVQEKSLVLMNIKENLLNPF